MLITVLLKHLEGIKQGVLYVPQGELKDKVKVEEEKKDEEKEDPKGIPEFWLTVFKNVDLLSEMLQVHVYQCVCCVYKYL